MTTTMMTTTVSNTRATIFHNATQGKGRITLREEKKDQTVDDEDNSFIGKC